MLKLFYDKAEEVPAALKEYYEEKGGKFQLKVEGVKTDADVKAVQDSLTAERNAHTKTKTDLTTAKTTLASFEGLDAADVHTKLGELETLKVTAGDKPDAAKTEAEIKRRVEVAVNQATNRLTRELDGAKSKLGEAEKKVGEFETTNKQRTMDDALRGVATEAKMEPTAVGDFLNLARADLVLGDDGKVTTKDGLDLKTYVSDQQKARPFLWASAKGAGANGSGSGDAGKNPFKKGTPDFNLTAQSHLVQTNRPEAERLAAAAGVTIAGAPVATA